MLSEILFDGLDKRAVIAGGYAACPALAEDIDVWVLGCEEPLYTRAAIVDSWLRRSTGAVIDVARVALMIDGEFRRFELADDRRTETFSHSYPDMAPWMICQVGKIMTRPKPIQVMTTNCHDVHALLSTFDISTHAVALDPNTLAVIRHEHWTPTNVDPVMLRYTPTTNARINKLCARYGTKNKYQIQEPVVVPF